MDNKKRVGRPKGSTTGVKKQPITVMLFVDEIVKAGGVIESRKKIINNFSKL